MFCNNCGKQLPDGSAFCDGCGAPLNAPAPQVAPAPQAPMGQPPMQGYQVPPPTGVPYPGYAPEPQQPKKKSFLKIFLGIFGAIVALGVIIGIVSSIFAVPYTKGEMQGDIYVNEWANLKYDTKDLTVDPAGLVDKVDVNQEQGLVVADEKQQNLQIVFEDLGDKKLDEKGTLENMKNKIQADYEEQFSNVETKCSEITTVTVAGEKYQTMDIEISFTFLGQEGYMVQKVYIRGIDHHAVFILVTAQSLEEVTPLMDRFSSYK